MVNASNAGADSGQGADYAGDAVGRRGGAISDFGKLDACVGADEKYQLFNILQLFFIGHSDVFTDGTIC